MRDLFGEASANRSASWHPPPETRGSFNILISCLITLGLCVWSAVHLNIPEQGLGLERKWYDLRAWVKVKYWRKIGWLILALLAPEMVTFTAWIQRREAFRLTKHIKKKLYVSQEDDCIPLRIDGDIESCPKCSTFGNAVRRHDWTHVHSFFVLEGGLAIDTSELTESEKYLPGNRDSVTLTAQGVYYLFRYHPLLLPDISEESILDKSKADGFAKVIVCIQIVRFMVQCLARLATPGCSISLLELNTFAHAVCTLLIYGLWWDKPFDVGEPERIFDPLIHDFCAYYCFESGPSLSSQDYLVSVPSRSTLVERAQQYVPDVDVASSEAMSLALHVGYAQERSEKEEMLPIATEDRCIPGTMAKVTTKRGLYGKCVLKSTPRDRERWNRATCFSVIAGKPESMGWNTVRDRLRNLPVDFDFFAWMDIFPLYTDKEIERKWRAKQLPDGVPFLCGLTLAGLFYGGIHLLAWSAPFTSQIQHLLWKISGLAVTLSGPTVLILLGLHWPLGKCWFGVGKCLNWLEEFIDLFVTFLECGVIQRCLKLVLKLILLIMDCSKTAAKIAFFLAILAGALLYLSARIYLVVECFISLAYLPKSAFIQPRWTAYFPHIQ